MEWKKIEGYENYSVSSNGDVRNDETGIILKVYYNQGYQLIKLRKNGKRKMFRVHRLVAQAFIPNPENKPCVDHINTIRDDNRVENLKWVTHKENMNNPLSRKNSSESKKGEKNYWYGKQHTKDTKEKMSEAKKGENNPNYGKQLSKEHRQKLIEANTGKNHPRARKIICITTGEVFDYIRQASEKYKVNHQNISKCCNKKRNSAGKHPETGEPLVWMYYFDDHEGAMKNE